MERKKEGWDLQRKGRWKQYISTIDNTVQTNIRINELLTWNENKISDINMFTKDQENKRWINFWQTWTRTHWQKGSVGNYCCDLTRPCYIILGGLCESMCVCAMGCGVWGIVLLSTNVKASAPKRLQLDSTNVSVIFLHLVFLGPLHSKSVFFLLCW